MKKVTSAKVRQCFLDFFAERGHTIVPSASLAPLDDPTLLFTNAGMNQFKDVFLDVGSRPYTRAADTQKCMRVSGKHNDLDDVGRDGTHHTFFEMLGNWSFGDYYKKEVIAWAWELLTDVWGLSEERVWATVFKDELGELEADEEAAGYWRSETGIDPDHILYDGRKENFWEMADTGPCGPCSEVHYDRGPETCERQGEPGHICRVNGDCGRFIELWNLVFIQYNKDADGVLHPLPAKHVDTGLGFERLLAVLQGVDSNYKTDLFMPIIRRVQEMAGHTDADVQENIVAYRVIADHGRAITFLVGDGVLPGSEGRDYVLRMILRRAARFGRKLGFTEPFLVEVAEVVIETMGVQFPELTNRRPFILATIAQEEERFLRTLDLGLAQLDKLVNELRAQGGRSPVEATATTGGIIPGDEAFRLYDTLGLPLEITRDVAEEEGLSVDETGYQAALDEQRRRSREAESFAAYDEESLARYQNVLTDLQAQGLLGDDGVEHDPYSTIEQSPVEAAATTGLETTIAAILRDGAPVESAPAGAQVEVVLPVTGFYFESGGQVSDTGFINGKGEEPAWEIEVQDVRQPVAGLIVHAGLVTRGQPRAGDAARTVLDRERRMDIARNHTATHLLQNALRRILGEHVQQAGSLVAPDRLRFDFTHPAMLTQEELAAVARAVNDAILVDYPVGSDEKPYRQALNEGVIALFNEKYGDVVRVLCIGQPDEPFSQELCGGTHVSKTGEIGLFHVTSQESVGAGVRRIEAVTGRAAVDLVERQLGRLKNAASHLGVPPDEVDCKTLELLDELHDAQKEIARLQQRLAKREFETLLERAQSVAGISLVSAQVKATSVEALREMTDWFRDRLGSGVFVLGTVLDGRPAIVASVTPDVVERGVDAVELVRGMARVVGGGGGGSPTMAQAGGRDSGKLDEALRQAPSILEEQLAG